MAESTLSLEYDDLANAVSRFMFGNADYSTLAAADQATIDVVVQAGYMQFLYPPALEGIPDGYEWSFLKPTTTLTTIAPYETGTVEVVTDVCTLTAGTWPSWAATHGILVIDGTEYTVVSRDSDVLLTVSAEGDVTAGEDDWSIAHTGDYDLPDDFGRIIGNMEWGRGIQRDPVTFDVGEGRINSLRNLMDETGYPRVGAVRIKALGDGTTGQRREAMLYPRPDAAYTFYYRYEAFIGKLLTGDYPLGAMKHAETLRLSCLAKAEMDVNDESSIHRENFLLTLRSSIGRDKKQGASLLGGPDGNVYDGGSDTYHNYGLTVNDTRLW